MFYHPQIEIGKKLLLDSSESKHLILVLRKNVGESVFLTNGNGGLFEAEILVADSKKTRVHVHKRIKSQSITAEFHIAIAPTKNISRFEFFLEKATEIGVSEITPLICRRSERRKLNIERLHKKMVNGMKQSQNLCLPILNTAANFDVFCRENKFATSGSQKFICSCEKETELLKTKMREGKNTLVLVGPEGDFSKEETNLAIDSGFETVSLGDRRFRVETAGILACHTFFNKNQI